RRRAPAVHGRGRSCASGPPPELGEAISASASARPTLRTREPTNTAPAGMPSRPVPSLRNQRLVDELLHLAAHRVGAGGEQLCHEEGGDLLGRINPERRAGGPSPGELALAAQDLVGNRVVDHTEAKPEPDSGKGG